MITLESEKARPQRACTSSRASSWARKVKAAPRSTMPNKRRVSGMNSVVEMAAKARGKPVKTTTMTRMSQTWFASQMGPMAPSIRSR